MVESINVLKFTTTLSLAPTSFTRSKRYTTTRRQSEAKNYIKEHLSISTDAFQDADLLKIAKCCIMRNLRDPKTACHFGPLIVAAARALIYHCPNGDSSVLLDRIKWTTHVSRAVLDSYLPLACRIKFGVASACGSFPTRMTNVKILCVNGTLLPTELPLYMVDRKDMVDKFRLAKTNAEIDIVFTTGDLDEICFKHLSEFKVLVIPQIKISDLDRIAEGTRATVISSLYQSGTNWTFLENWKCVGLASEISSDFVDSDCYLRFHEPVEFVLHASPKALVNAVEKCVRAALDRVKVVLDGQSVLAGGGSVECALSIYLGKYAANLGDPDRAVISEFAKSFDAIPLRECDQVRLYMWECKTTKSAECLLKELRDRDFLDSKHVTAPFLFTCLMHSCRERTGASCFCQDSHRYLRKNNNGHVPPISMRILTETGSTRSFSTRSA